MIYKKQAYQAEASLLWILVCLFLFLSCKPEKQQRSGGTLLARVYDRQLYAEDLKSLVPKGTSGEDSITILKSYVQNWVNQQITLKKAEENLDDEQKDVSLKLEEYRNSLITYVYESELIRQKLDTVVEEDEISKYYSDHEKYFELRDNIIKVNYVKVPHSAPRIDQVRKWYKSKDADDHKNLEEYSFQFATEYYFNDDDWMVFDELIGKIPVRIESGQQEFLKDNRNFEVSDSTGTWFVSILEFKIKQSLSPLSFERENIRNLIINKRKLELIRQMEKAAYDQAIKENEIEIHI